MRTLGTNPWAETADDTDGRAETYAKEEREEKQPETGHDESHGRRPKNRREKLSLV